MIRSASKSLLAPRPSGQKKVPLLRAIYAVRLDDKNHILAVGVFRGVSGCPEPPLAMIFFKSGGDTLTGTELHQPLKFATFGNPPETNSGYATDLATPSHMHSLTTVEKKKKNERTKCILQARTCVRVGVRRTIFKCRCMSEVCRSRRT